jgi:hypothetical protein
MWLSLAVWMVTGAFGVERDIMALLCLFLLCTNSILLLEIRIDPVVTT